jgi:hypothetical protein
VIGTGWREIGTTQATLIRSRERCSFCDQKEGAMGLFATRWETTYEGHCVVVSRREWTRTFKLEWDGKEIANSGWTLLGLGKVQGVAETEGRRVEVKVVIRWEGFSDMDGKCYITVDDQQLEVTKVK